MHQYKTARLKLELMDEQDKELLYELDQDPQVMRFITGGVTTTRQALEEVGFYE